MASSKSGSGAMTLERMSVEQLKAVKEQADMEVNLLQDSLNNIGTATTRLELATTDLNDLSLSVPSVVKSLFLSPLPSTFLLLFKILITFSSISELVISSRKPCLKERITASAKSIYSNLTLINLLRLRPKRKMSRMKLGLFYRQN
uniref:Prefoldin n=1 Tax=Medicago truncatula TaxID=3880 RepID=I3SCH5_MEDTR|nr:unknown [Medicago truncatula]